MHWCTDSLDDIRDYIQRCREIHESYGIEYHPSLSLQSLYSDICHLYQAVNIRQVPLDGVHIAVYGIRRTMIDVKRTLIPLN